MDCGIDLISIDANPELECCKRFLFVGRGSAPASSRWMLNGNGRSDAHDCRHTSLRVKFGYLICRPRYGETLAPQRRCMESQRYNYGSGAGTGGKIRRHPPSRAVAASPYARPATAPTHAPGTATAAVSHEGGWLSRIIAAGTSRFLPSLFSFSTSQPQHAAPAPSPTRDQLPVVEPPSPLPPPLGFSLHIFYCLRLLCCLLSVRAIVA